MANLPEGDPPEDEAKALKMAAKKKKEEAKAKKEAAKKTQADAIAAKQQTQDSSASEQEGAGVGGNSTGAPSPVDARW